ncbi:hypothetical protein [Streptomyces deccanensis]|uniref:hypothetical protein n=1 Tax=Streptomyces deccanensis TaxID=424188 RepID=UPI001EFB2181|nr:hypothetical protein [Streptomyces deccanensis]ULR51348.1 hypothetical protein L3078_19725 [Streptomyces deccanensis]
MSRAARRPRRGRAATLAALSAAALLSTTACTSEVGGEAGAGGRQTGGSVEQPGAKATPASDATEGDTAHELANEAPDPVADRVVLRQNKTRDSAHLEFGAARKGEGKALTVAVNCQGEGTIEVTLRPTGASFPMKCLDGEVTSTNNEFTIAGAERAGTISVAAAPGVRWSLSMGRGEPAGQDLRG